MTDTGTIDPSALDINGRGMLTLNSAISPSKRSYTSVESDLSEGVSPSRQRKPMRKRAKTQEEKEERAQERIMRNRAAAQVSRERKREHMVTLEVENEQLMQRISTLTADNDELRTNMTTLTQRLENMEKMLAYFTAPPTQSTEEHASQFTCPTPPGTVRPQDLQSSTSTPVLASIDSRNPAAIATDPQRRILMRSPWTPSSRSPMYKQMETILSFWTAILRVTSSPTFTTQITNYLKFRCIHSRKQSLHRSLNHWRCSATGLHSRARIHSGEHAPSREDGKILTYKSMVSEDLGSDDSL